MTYHPRQQAEDRGRHDCRLLCRDHDTSGQMPLLANDTTDAFGELVGICIRQVFMGLIEY
jgi:hypothetical protein